MNIARRVDKMSVDLDKFVERASIWQSLFDECPIAVAIFTNEMKFFMINEAFTALTGYDPESIINRKIEYVLPNRFKKDHKNYEKTYARHPVKKVNRHGLQPGILHKNGNEVAVDIDLSYIVYDTKIYYVAFIRKIS